LYGLRRDQDISWEMYSQIVIVALSGYPPGVNKLYCMYCIVYMYLVTSLRETIKDVISGFQHLIYMNSFNYGSFLRWT
jgi:hypothetical protein